MNELTLKPAVEFEHIGTKYCFNVIDSLYIQAIPFEKFEKGYAWFSCPCFCYASIVKKIHDQYNDVCNFPLEILNSEKRIEFLKRIIERKDYKDCWGCPKLEMAPTTGFWNRDDFEYAWGETGIDIWRQYSKKKLTNPLPYTIVFNLDSSCNLKCKTCRPDYIRHTYDITEEDSMQLIEMAKMVPHISIGGDGEFFTSHNYDALLAADLTENSKLRYITLYTNGTLMNETNWNKINLATRQKLIKEIKVSMDAACEETYLKVRGPWWNQLIKNLDFIRPIAKTYGIEMFTTFTISKYNVQDVSKFHDFAKSLGFDRVMFQFAREIFHPELGEGEDFIVPPDQRKDIMDYLLELQRQEGPTKVIIE